MTQSTETQAEKHLKEIMQKVKENPEVKEARKAVLKEKVQSAMRDLSTAIQTKPMPEILAKANTFRFHAQNLLNEDGLPSHSTRGRPKKK